jgi:hypothetical protein
MQCSLADVGRHCKQLPGSMQCQQFFNLGCLLGWQLHCHPRKTPPIQGRQYNCRPNAATLQATPRLDVRGIVVLAPARYVMFKHVGRTGFQRISETIRGIGDQQGASGRLR